MFLLYLLMLLGAYEIFKISITHQVYMKTFNFLSHFQILIITHDLYNIILYIRMQCCLSEPFISHLIPCIYLSIKCK